MSLLMPTHLTAVETAGVAVLRVTWSDKLRQRLATQTGDRIILRVLREAYEGLPLRVAEQIAGEQVLSHAGVGVPAGWYRQRVDTVADGAPRAFVPGLSILGPVGAEPVTLSYAPGSARLPHDAPVPVESATDIELAPGDVVVADSRCALRLSDPAAVFQLSVVRAWLEPERDFTAFVTRDVLPRVARFAGVASVPAATPEQWLFERHERRPE
jgi:hypothetical protein